MSEWRGVVRKFYADRWYLPGEAVDVSDEKAWRNAKTLETAKYLRRMEFGEEPVASGDGRFWVNATLAERAGGALGRLDPADDDVGERASSDETDAEDEPQGSSEDGDAEDAPPPVPDAGGDIDAPSPPVPGKHGHSYTKTHLGGGWWQVDDEHGTKMNARALHGEAAADKFIQGLVEGA